MSKIATLIERLFSSSKGKTDDQVLTNPDFGNAILELSSALKPEPAPDEKTGAKLKFAKGWKITTDPNAIRGKKTLARQPFKFEGDAEGIPIEAIPIVNEGGEIESLLIDGVEVAPVNPAEEVQLAEEEKLAEEETKEEDMNAEYPISETMTLVVTEIGEPVYVRDNEGNQILAAEGSHRGLDGTEVVIDAQGNLMAVNSPTEEEMAKYKALFSTANLSTAKFFAARFKDPGVRKTKFSKAAPAAKTKPAPETAELVRLKQELAKAQGELDSFKKLKQGKTEGVSKTLSMKAATADYQTTIQNGGLN